MAWVMAMDYPAFDYTNDRIRGLEHEVKELREELRRTRISSETATVGSSGMTPLRRAPGGSQ
jgi:hypothetical protein